MGIRVDQNILNQKGTPAFNASPFFNRPAAGFLGRIFISTDTYEIYRDEGVGWSLIADAGAGSGNLESVTFNGNNTPYGINITNGGLFLLGSTNGSIFFAAGGSGQFTTDNANFFWDDTNNRLGIGTAVPSAKLDVHSSSGTSAILNGTGVSNALLTFQKAGVNKWSVGNFVSSTVADDFNIYDTVNTVSRLQVHNTGVVNIPTSLIIGTTTPTSIYAFDVTGTSRFTAQITGLSATLSSTLTLSTITAGSVLFAGASGVVSQDNANLFWDDTNNRLGIGTTSAESRFQIQGGQDIGSGVDGFGQFKIRNSDFGTRLSIHARADDPNLNDVVQFKAFTNNGSLAQFSFNNDVAINAGGKLELYRPDSSAPSPSWYWNIYMDASNLLNFGINGGTGKMFLNASGNLAVGVTTGTVNGKVCIEGEGTSTSNIHLELLTDTNRSYIQSANRTFIANAPITIECSSILITPLAGAGSRAVLAAADGTLSAPVSDISVKENIVPIGYGLNEIIKMNPIWFNFIDEYKNYGETRQNGNIAQEMELIIPEAVFITPSTGKMGIEYSQLHAVYIKAIQELNEKLVRNNIN